MRRGKVTVTVRVADRVVMNHLHDRNNIWIRMVYALAYVPTEHVLEVYDTIEWPDILLAFISQYFEGLGCG